VPNKGVESAQDPGQWDGWVTDRRVRTGTYLLDGVQSVPVLPDGGVVSVTENGRLLIINDDTSTITVLGTAWANNMRWIDQETLANAGMTWLQGQISWSSGLTWRGDQSWGGGNAWGGGTAWGSGIGPTTWIDDTWQDQDATGQPAPEPTPTATPTQEPALEPDPTTNTDTMTDQEPAPTPTEEPTATPTEEPTATPTQEATPTPIAEPVATATQEPTPTPTEDSSSAPAEEPAPVAMQIVDLAGTALDATGNHWTTVVTVTVYAADQKPLAGVTVAGGWESISVSCTTGSNGQCSVSAEGLKKNKVTAVAFTFDSASHASYRYQPENNSDPDSDSDGTTITVKAPAS